MQLAIGVMQRQIEHRATDQRGQPGHGFATVASLLVKFSKETGQNGFLKFVTDFQRVARAGEARPGFRQPDTEFFECRVAFVVRNFAGPNPLHAKGRLAPAFGRFAASIHDHQASARTRD